MLVKSLSDTKVADFTLKLNVAVSWIASFFLLLNRKRKEEQNFGTIRAHCYFNGEQMVPWVVAKSRNIFQIENKKYMNELIANFELKYNEAASWTVAIFLYLNMKGWEDKERVFEQWENVITLAVNEQGYDWLPK